MSFISVPAAGTPLLRDTPQQIDAASRALASGTGPIAIDTERASAYRYDDRAFLIQLRRHGSGTFLIDPEAEPQATRRMAEVVNEADWVLHAAHTDLPCLMALGWHPQVLHDTQIAGQLLGAERIGLSGMLDAYFDIQVPKDKGNADWSRRPLTQAMLNYAALDVEWLLEPLDCCLEELAETGRTKWYIQECQHVLASASPLSANDWTDLKGLSSLRRALPRRIAHDLWESRDAMARRGDISPESILRSRDLVDIAGRAERDRADALQQLNSCLHRSRARMKPWLAGTWPSNFRTPSCPIPKILRPNSSTRRTPPRRASRTTGPGLTNTPLRRRIPTQFSPQPITQRTFCKSAWTQS